MKIQENQNIVSDVFLTNIINKKCYNLLTTTQPVHFKKNAIYTYKFPYDPEIISWCNNKKFFYVGSQITLKRVDKKDSKLISVQKKTPITLTKEIYEKDKKILKKISLDMSQSSRFYCDPYIRPYAATIYTQWLMNSIFEKYTTDYIIARENNNIVGICTLRVIDTIPRIDLLGVVKSHKRQGIGSLMLETLIKKKNNVNIYVGTQGQNIPALNFYIKNGFIFDSYDLIFHKHT
jgi:GNAT superfamily N-acetyltransferase